MGVPIECILSALRCFPKGATTAQLGAKLGMTPATISGRLSKLAMYGKIGANRQTRYDDGEYRRFYIWSANA